MITLLLALACLNHPKDDPPPVDDTDVADDTDETDPPDTDIPADPPCAPGVVAQNGAIAWTDLQQALDAVLPGDTLDLCPATHTLPLRWFGPGPLTLRSWTGDPDDVIFDGLGVHTPLTIRTDDLDLVVDSLTFRNGKDHAGGGLAIHADTRFTDSRVVVRSCHFEDNDAFGYGSALYIDAVAEVSLHDIVVTGNTGPGGPPVVLDRVFRLADVQRSSFTDNEAAGSAALGIYHATLSTETFTVDILDSTFADNVATDGAYGTAVIIGHEAPAHIDLRVLRSSFLRNIDNGDDGSQEYGGALLLANRLAAGTTTTLIEGCTFDGNVGGQAVHFGVLWRADDGPADITIRDTAFYRGDFVDRYGFDPTALAFSRRPSLTQPFLIHFDNVDFGSGTTANLIPTFSGCPDHYEGLFTGTLDVRFGAACP